MCGIVAFFSSHEINNHEECLKKMTQSVLHRGPDEDNYHITCINKEGLGQTRLSIIDIENGKQPFVDNKTGNIIVYNGELYNYIELRQKLKNKGILFNTSSDTEVIIKAYEYWGIDFLQHLSGMFAFVIYDKSNHQYIIVRDRFGIKPLYYYQGEGILLVASEIKSILATGRVKTKLNYASLLMQLSYGHIIDNSTLFADIKQVLPGQVYTYQNNQLIQKYYYKIEDKNFGNNKISFKDAKQQVNNLLRKSIQQHLLSDVKVVTSLSGGLDSSIVTTLAAKNQSIEAFAIGYGRTDDEIPYAEKVIVKNNIPFHTYLIDIDRLNSSLIKLLYHLEEPLPHTQISTTFFASHHVKNSLNAKVCLLGEGADEIFGGYNFPKMANELKSVLLGKNYVYRKYKEMFFNLLPHYKGRIFNVDNDFIFEQFWNIDNNRCREYKKVSNNTVHFIMLSDFKELLPNSQLNRVDKLYMANSIEARVPFLDPELVELVWSLPVNFKIGPPEKKIARETFKDILPPEICIREKFGTHGSQNPFSTWWAGGLKDMLENEIKNGLIKRGIFDSDFIRLALNNYLPNNVKVIMTLGFLEILLKIYDDNNSEYIQKAIGTS